MQREFCRFENQKSGSPGSAPNLTRANVRILSLKLMFKGKAPCEKRHVSALNLAAKNNTLDAIVVTLELAQVLLNTEAQ